MSNVLKAGKLPAPTHIVEEAVVGSSLGAEAIQDGIWSSAVGLVIVLVFMFAYYSKAGWIADIALLINLFFLLGVMASLGAVLTLSGIAGIVLSIGMAVDANVLIYEGIKVELEAGKPFAQSVKDGFKHSLTAIIDSNVTTFDRYYPLHIRNRSGTGFCNNTGIGSFNFSFQCDLHYPSFAGTSD
jgi:SecD/SecF fusion protein